MRLMQIRAMLLVAGAASALGFAPLDFWPLTFIGLALLVDRLVHARSPREAFVSAWTFGVGHFVAGLNWIATAFTYQANMPAWLGAPAVLLLSLYLALFPAMAGVIAWRVARHHDGAFVFTFAAAWILGEWLRATLFTGFAWNPLGVVWLGVPWIARSASWMGTYGLSGVVVLVAGSLWLVQQRQWRISLGVALALGAVQGGFWLLPAETQVSRGGSAVAVRIVQPNIGQGEKYDSALAARHARLYARLSGKPASTPRLLLWPEAATLRFLELEPGARAELAALLGPGDILITGGASVSDDPRSDEEIYHNSVFALDHTGAILWRYDKAHLVPFGEYLPWRRLLEPLGLSRLVPGDGDFAAGPGPRSFALPGFGSARSIPSVGLQICYEIIFSGRVIDKTERPAFLFNPSNDAWFGAWGPPQHLAQAQLRAIEEGLPVVRATPNGISALIDPTGKTLAIVPSHQAGVIDALLPQALGPTVFSRFGLWTSVLFALALGAVAAGISRMTVDDGVWR